MSFWSQLDAMVAEHRDAERGPRTELSLTEIMLIEKLQRSVTFVPASAHKRFVRDLSAKSKLSDRGRAYLAYIAHRYRRQWTPSDEEFEWMLRWKNYREPRSALWLEDRRRSEQPRKSLSEVARRGNI